jgi:hypothetical protein
MKKALLIFLTIFALPLLACGASGGFDVRVDEQYSYLTITMSEQDISNMLIPALQNGRDLRVENATLDLRPGEIIVMGSVVGDGGRLYPGSMSLRAWAANGRLHLAVGTFSFAGFNASQQQIAQFNADLEAGLAQDAAEDDSETTDVTITDTSLSITWRSPR